MFSLLKSSFRQNPDYVIVGEVRGQEASVLFQGMASGHSSISTMHGDSVESIVRRLQTPPISLSPMLVNGLDVMAIMTHAIVNGKETRRLREIVEVVNVTPDGTTTTNTPFKWNPADDKFYSSKESKVFDKIGLKAGLDKAYMQKEFETRTRLIYALFQKKVLAYDEVQRVINDYAKSPEVVLKKYGVVRS
jgi:flagellar protein FlaI